MTIELLSSSPSVRAERARPSSAGASRSPACESSAACSRDVFALLDASAAGRPSASAARSHACEPGGAAGGSSSGVVRAGSAGAPQRHHIFAPERLPNRESS